MYWKKDDFSDATDKEMTEKEEERTEKQQRGLEESRAGQKRRERHEAD